MTSLPTRKGISFLLTALLLLTLPAHKACSQPHYDLHKHDPSKLLDGKGCQFEKYHRQSPPIEFAGRAIFDSAIFTDTMDLSQAQFDTASYFSYVRFRRMSSFANATFIGITNFGASQFDAVSTFSDADFQDTALFRSDNFIGPCRFTDATFESGSIFSGSGFLHGAWFDNVTFRQVAYFENTRFSGYTKFTNLTFLDSAYIDFSNSHLPDTLDLSNNGSFKRVVDLTTANFIDSPRYNRRSGYYNPHNLYLYRTDISRIHLDYEHFRLLLPDTALSPDAFGLFQPISVDEKEAMYEALLNNFRLSGQAESFRYLDIEYQEFRWWHSWAALFTWVPYTWNYFGYEKELIFVWIIGFMILFTIINYKCLDLLNGKVYHVLDIEEEAASLPWKRRMQYAFLYTTNIFFPLKLELKNLDFGKIIPTAYVLFMYVMGILCLGYLANFILQK